MTSRPLFLEEDDSDTDTISLTSTRESDDGKEYVVEKILAEAVNDDDGKPYYLTKWAGYELAQSTWEPESSFNGPDLILDWKTTQKRIEQGLEPGFDLEDFYTKVNGYNKAKRQRKIRRNEKRRKLGLPTTSYSDTEDQLSDGETESVTSDRVERPVRRKRLVSGRELSGSISPAAHSPGDEVTRTRPRKKSKTAIVEKKGVARKRTAERTVVLSSDEAQHTSTDVESLDDSLFDEFVGEDSNASPRLPATTKTSKATVTDEFGGKDSNAGPKLPPTTKTPKATVKPPVADSRPVMSKVRQSGSTTQPPINKPTIADIGKFKKPKPTTTSVDSEPAVASTSSSVSKSATTARKTTKPVSVFASWTKPVKSRQRPRVNDKTAKDSTEKLFGNLSIQNRFQRYRENEPAPDVNALTFIDPTTGKPTSLNSPIGNPTDSVATSVRTVAPAGITVRKTSEVSLDTASRPLHTDPVPVNSYQWRKQNVTCRFWLRGTCKLTPETCKFAHKRCAYFAPKTRAICKFWQRSGYCKWSDEECEYYHGPVPPPDGSPFESAIQRADGTSGIDLRNHEGVTEDGSVVPRPPEACMRVAQPSHKVNTSSSLVEAPPRDTIDDTFSLVQSPEHIGSTDIATTEDVESPAPGMIPAQISILQQGPQPTIELRVHLTFDTGSERTAFVSMAGSEVNLQVKQLCIARDFQQFCYQKSDKPWASGEVRIESADLSEHIVEYLLLTGGGLVINESQFLMVIYPTNADDWKFFRKAGTVLALSGLGFHVLPPLAGDIPTQETHRSEMMSITPTETPIQAVGERLLDLKEERLFSGAGKTLDKVVFLMFPPDHPHEQHLVTAYLHSLGATVFSATTPGAWQYFVQKLKSGVVIFHSSVYNYWQIPNFSRVLRQGINIFELGVDEASQPQSAGYTCTRLFPHGSVLLITDDVFLYHPQRALSILEKCRSDHEGKPAGARNDRILTRPGLKQWLFELMDMPDHSRADNVSGNGNQIDWIKLYYTVCEILTPGDGMVVPEDCLIVSPPVEELPSYPPMWDTDQGKATDYLVNWFAGWCVSEKERFRRFTVCHRGRDGAHAEADRAAKSWMKEYQHVRVLSPSQWQQERSGKT